tara:strand:+ start:441 stop:857 length:417 start_codon:yes stop_codon:yes gene_type:complete
MPYANKEERSRNARKYYLEKKEQIKQKSRDDYHKKTYKQQKIRSWKNQGFWGDLEQVFDEYNKSTNCFDCSVEFKEREGRGTSATTKCCDHNHTTRYYRNTICSRCNFQRQYVDKKYDYVLMELNTIHNMPQVLKRFS